MTESSTGKAPEQDEGQTSHNHAAAAGAESHEEGAAAMDDAEDAVVDGEG